MLQFDVEASFKRNNDENFVKVFKWEKIDLCKLTSDIESYTLIRNQIQMVNRSLNGNLHKCPYKQFNVNEVTASFSNFTDEKEISSSLPNGISKISILFKSKSKYLGFFEFSTTQFLV